MTTILGLAGSLRSGSLNAKLLRAAAKAAGDSATVEIATIAGIPLYDADEEAREFPETVRALKQRITEADALLLVTPEYNNSIPGVFKNAIDWLSRPASDITQVFGDRPVALIGATPGQGGTLLAQAAWLPVLRTLGMRPWFGGRFSLSAAGKAFDDEGSLIEERSRSQLQTFMQGFAAFAGKH